MSQDRATKKLAAMVMGLVIAAVVLWNMGAVKQTASQPVKSTGQWQVYFSPNGGCTDAIVRTVGAAKKTVLVQAYSFTSQPIAKALLSAKKRGVDVKVILDKSQVSQKYSSARFFKNQGMDPWIDSAHAIAHNKVMVIDGATVITGSFNFTKAAEEKNAENLLIIRDPKLASLYAKNWEKHKVHSQLY